MQKTLAAKLALFRESSSNRAFIIADAKDADMAFGIASPGKTRDGSYRSLTDFRDQIREIVAQGLVDIMLMSASTSEIVTICEKIFERSARGARERHNGHSRHPRIDLSRGTIETIFIDHHRPYPDRKIPSPW
jgi:hypothetical protein